MKEIEPGEEIEFEFAEDSIVGKLYKEYPLTIYIDPYILMKDTHMLLPITALYSLEQFEVASENTISSDKFYPSFSVTPFDEYEFNRLISYFGKNKENMVIEKIIKPFGEVVLKSAFSDEVMNKLMMKLQPIYTLSSREEKTVYINEVNRVIDFVFVMLNKNCEIFKARVERMYQSLQKIMQLHYVSSHMDNPDKMLGENQDCLFFNNGFSSTYLFINGIKL